MEITWTNHAMGDLARLYEFLEPVNPMAAAAVFERLMKGPDILLEQPRIGTPLTEFSPRDVRFILVGDYEMRYELTQDMIWILRLWHTREDR
jgi:plasmid stabilization system protein ParE